MDIPREPKNKHRKFILPAVGMVVLVLATLGLRQLKPAAPSVEWATIWTDQVVRGEFVRRVRGPGTLVPVQMRFIPALTAGRIDRILVEEGAVVEEGTLIMQLSNPDVELQLVDAERQLASAQASFVELRSRLRTQSLQQEGVVATTRQRYRQAVRTADANDELVKKNLIPQIEYENSLDQVEELKIRLEVDENRLRIFAETIDDQLAAQEDQVRRWRNVVRVQRERLASMQVVATTSGVVSNTRALEEGQWVQSGQTLARIVRPDRLKAELRIPETQARNVAVGQLAFIDTRTDTIPGRVSRIDPAAVNGAVTIDVVLTGPLPRGARPDLSVDGTVEIERLSNVLYVGRPAYGQANSQVGLFRLAADSGEAARVTVRLGASSVNAMQILDGLNEGDVIILSDMSRWDAFDRVRLK